MPALNDIYLGPLSSEILLSPLGRTMTEAMIEIAREDRTASGRLVKDFIATKRKFTFQYSLISHTNLSAILTLYNYKTELNLKVTRPTWSVETYTVILKPFDRERAKSYGTQYWANVNIEVEEV